MSSPLRFTRLARDDINAALDWYDAVRPGLGGEFLLALEACLELMSRHPQIGAAQPFGTRRKLLHRFPYAVHYRPGPQGIDVLGVLPQMIDPASTIARLEP